jgi:hypothetical protein
VIAIYLPCSLNLSLGIVNNNEVRAATFHAEVVDAEVLNGAVEVRESVI